MAESLACVDKADCTTDLPKELWNKVFHYLSEQDLFMRVGATSRLFRDLARDKARVLEVPPNIRAEVPDEKADALRLEHAWVRLAARAKLSYTIQRAPLLLDGHRAGVRHVAFASESGQAITIDGEGTLRFFTLIPPFGSAPENGPLAPRGLASATTGQEMFRGMHLMSSGKTLLLTSDHGISLHHSGMNSRRQHLFTPGILSTAKLSLAHASRDAQSIVATADNDGLYLWQVAHDGLKTRPDLLPPMYHLHGQRPLIDGRFVQCAIAPDAGFVIARDSARQCWLWRLHGAKFGMIEMGPATCTTFSLSPNGRFLATAHQSHDIWVRTTKRNPPRSDITSSIALELGRDETRCMAFAPDHKIIAIGLATGEILIWRFSTPKQQTYARLGAATPGAVTSLSWAEDGKSLLSGGDDDHQVRLRAVPPLP